MGNLKSKQARSAGRPQIKGKSSASDLQHRPRKPCAGNVRVQGFAKIVQNGLTIAAGASMSSE